jgi:hypothetical protein
MSGKKKKKKTYNELQKNCSMFMEDQTQKKLI